MCVHIYISIHIYLYVMWYLISFSILINYCCLLFRLNLVYKLRKGSNGPTWGEPRNFNDVKLSYTPKCLIWVVNENGL